MEADAHEDQRTVRLLPAIVLALLTTLATGAWVRDTVRIASETPSARASDALPVYLGVATVRAGGDPTDAAALEATYRAERMQVTAALFSTLYPASTPALLAPAAPARWPTFVAWWRGVLVWSAVVAGASGAMSGTPRRRWWLAAPIGAAVATVCFPASSGAVLHGQMNPALAAIAGLAQLAVAEGVVGVGAGLLVLGGGLKLVPLFAAWPLVAARRWRALLAGGLVGVAILAATATVVPLGRAFAALVATVRFEAEAGGMPGLGVTPDSPYVLQALVVARHVPLALATIAVAGVAAWRAPRRPEVLGGGIALVFAWLAADASGQHMLYLPLVLAALAWAVTWPLADDAPRWAWAAPLAALPFSFLTGGGAPPELIGLFGAVLVWLVAAARIVRAAGLLRRDRIALAAALLVAAGIATRGPTVVPMDGRRPPGEDRARPDVHVPGGVDERRPDGPGAGPPR